MGKPVVTVVPVGVGRFAILMLDPAEQGEPGTRCRNDLHGYTEAELRGILTNCYKLSRKVTERSILSARGQNVVLI
jgi:hypothetical protein